jgi:peroxiredoxin
MKQFVQLQEQLGGFESAGIAVVAMTYDAPELQQAFIDEQGISYPMLSDIDASSVKALGILNTKYQPGDNAYGIPYPGIFVVAPDMTIVGKIFVEGYSTRVDAAAVLVYAREVLGVR